METERLLDEELRKLSISFKSIDEKTTLIKTVTDIIRASEAENYSLKTDLNILQNRFDKALVNLENSRRNLSDIHRSHASARKLNEMTDIDEFRKSFLNCVNDILPYNEVAVFETTDGSPELCFPEVISTELQQIALAYNAEGIISWSVNEDRPIIMDAFAWIEQKSAYLIAPMSHCGKRVCVLIAELSKPKEQYNSFDLEIAANIISEAANSYSRLEVIDELKAARELLRKLVDNTTALVMTIGLEGKILFINRAVETFGYTEKSITGGNLSSVLEDKNDLEKLMHFEKDVITAEINLKTAAGEVRSVSATICKDLNNSGDCVGYIGFFEDVTEAKEAERKNLETERISAAVQTAITVNHEINNPLAIISGNIYLIREKAKELGLEDVLQKLEVMEINCRRIRSITSKLQNLQQVATTDYLEGIKMIDIRSESGSVD